MEGCGITEIGGYFATQPIGKEKPGSIGLPTARTEVRLVDVDGKAVPLGQPGEVLLKTPSAAVGYWDDPEATSSLFQDDWLRTGDIARKDEDGYLWFVGRRKLIIVRRGSNIAPAAVEILGCIWVPFLSVLSGYECIRLQAVSGGNGRSQRRRVLATHPEVQSSVVVGVPDELDGQVPIAWVLAKDKACPPANASLAEHMSKRLAAYEVPVCY